LLPLEDAVARVLALSRPLREERVPLREAAGRVLAAPVLAPRDLPNHDLSMMDGYALRAAEGQPGAAALEVAFEMAAGSAPGRALQAGQAARIFTGAPIPPGADCVVMQEHVHRDGGRVSVQEGHGAKAGQHVRRRGEEVREGAAVLPQATELGPAELSLLAACGAVQPLVHARPRVAILVTGDELVPPGVEPAPGQINETNSFALAQLVREAGAEAVLLGIAGDRIDEIAGRLGGSDADVLVTTGGASVGDHDHAQASAERIGGQLVFHQVAIRPGKPVLFGTIEGGRLLFGLPGNPAAAMLGFELFVRPALRRLMGGARPERAPARAVLQGAPLSRLPGLTHFPRGVVRAEGSRLVFTAGGHQSSMQIGSWAGVNAVGKLAPGQGRVEPGEELDVLLLRAL
jgi:molybdopterin molybdotransferase